MSDLSYEIQDKQRILFFGENARGMVNMSSKLLEHIHKAHDIITMDTHRLSKAPVVLIENHEHDLDHHILVVGTLNDEQKNKLEMLADRTPKAGSIVFNANDQEVNRICSKNRADVHQLPYAQDSNLDKDEMRAIKSLLTRLRVPEKDFNDSLATIQF
jgi:hypothetical protein